MKFVLLDVLFVQKFESPHLDQYNSSYDLNNRNYSSSGTVPRQILGTKLFLYFDEFQVKMGTKFDYTLFLNVVLPDV